MLKLLIVVAVFGLAPIARAGEQVGTLTRIVGDVKLFTHPSKTLQKNAETHALFEGEYYLVQPAHPGDKVEQGNILRTAPGAKVRVIFNNGDQYNVGSGTAYRVFWDKDAKLTETHIHLMYGKLRGIIEKGGPRSHLQIRTKTAIMGVRGTDFFIAADGKDGETEVSIMRGQVEVKSAEKAAPNAQKLPKPVKVAAGMSATVTLVSAKVSGSHEAGAAKLVPAIELQKTTQDALVAIQKSSEIVAKTPIAASASPKVTAEIAHLEKMAIETSLKDIHRGDRKLFVELEKMPAKTIDEINAKAVEMRIPDAPKAPHIHKPFKSEIENLENGSFDKYFKEYNDTN